ncbi:MAG: hypothetical protein JJU34_17735 [Lunatimonas sp.]|uniref:hypothetical protein n=1 Tax=Lunatimonas sp. TaxID=2060141 RepID=UPI00263AD0D0|nr:hypothetical protein [Lunatimonas sp.]MCC5939125.1 hypothetical protein [Lunatimonas sp.]
MGRGSQSRNYLTFLKEHPRLSGRIANGFNPYEPISRMGGLLELRLPEILQEVGLEFSQDLKDYLPFYQNSSGRVTNAVNKNLQALICQRIRDIGMGHEFEWLDDSSDSTKYLQLFWYCYARSVNPTANNLKSWASVKILDALSCFLGYLDFEDFIAGEYPPLTPGKPINVVLKKFFLSEEFKFVEDIIFELLAEMADRLPEELQLLTCDTDLRRGRKREGEEFLENRGLEPLESVLVMGEMAGTSQIRIQCHVFNEVWANHNGSWSDYFDYDALKDPHSTAYKKVKLSIYWCLFNRYFFYQNHELSYHYLHKAMDLGLDMHEVPFRVGVLKDLMEKPLVAKLHYVNLLKFLGVEDAANRHKEVSESGKGEPEAIDTGSGFKIGDDYIKLDDIKFYCPHFHPAMKTMYFEIVRMKLFSELKHKLDSATFQRVLDKIIKNTRGEWLKEEHRGLFGEANFEMGKWKFQKSVAGEFVSPEEIADYFVKAVTYSSLGAIHKECIPFLKNYGRFEEVRALVRQVHSQHPAIMSLYGLDG